MLLDRQGRVVKKYFGFGGPAQFERLRSDITALIAQRSR
jgi:hypothetical protein